MMHDILKSITRVFDDEEKNSENFIESLNYLDNLFIVCTHTIGFVPLNSLFFLPTFKGQNLCEKLGVACNDDESELKFFKIKSDMFLGDSRVISKIQSEFNLVDKCKSIIYNKDTDTLEIYLK